MITMNKNFFYRFFHHLKTVNHHRFLVCKHCFACGLYYQGLTHDLSKYSLAELIPSIRYYQGNRSPYAKEKELFGCSYGWLHHKGRNKHHWEYWYDLVGGKLIPIEMPIRYFVEMVCDRMAACKTYQGKNYTDASALEYFMTKKDRQYMHPQTAKQLEYILTLLKDKGEKETFRYLKNLQRGKSNE